MQSVDKLRQKYPTFIFESFNYTYRYNNLVISFKFSIPPDITFNPNIEILNIRNPLGDSTIKNLIFQLGLVEMMSYWKATCSQQIEIKAGKLNNEQLEWWQKLLQKGLGEFFYKNKINFKSNDFVKIKSTDNEIYQKDTNTHKDRFLILNSGGRDSAVSIETLKNLKKGISLLMLNPTKAALEVADKSGIANRIIVKRKIDKTLLELNENGYLNGHTPFSAYLAFLSVLCASVFDYKFAVVANERSSNEENTEYLGDKINHQYSKSFEFEKLFREYSKKYLSESTQYFSLLRPLYELQISKLFARHKKYFSNFKSCNVGQKQNIWCGKCPKCLSIFISLFPFLEDNDIKSIFNKNLYEDETLIDLLLHITGEKSPKPFECVGTYEEMLEGLHLSIRKLQEENRKLPYLLEYSKEKILNKNRTKPEILSTWDDNNFLSQEISQNLKTQIV